MAMAEPCWDKSCGRLGILTTATLTCLLPRRCLPPGLRCLRAPPWSVFSSTLKAFGTFVAAPSIQKQDDCRCYTFTRAPERRDFLFRACASYTCTRYTLRP